MREPGAVLALVAVLALTGCDSNLPIVGDEPDWRTSTTPLDHASLVWAMGSTVHFADGTTVDTDDDIHAYVVAGDGVFFVPFESDDDGDFWAFGDTDLFYVAPGTAAVKTGLSVDSSGVAVTPDGNRLVILDDDDDAGTAVMRFFDLHSGEEITSKDGWDTSGIDDPEWYFNESEVKILAITDSHVYARTIDGEYSYDLTTGEGQPLDDDVEVPGYGDDPNESPDGEWIIEDQETMQDAVVSTNRADVVPLDPGSSRWYLSGWLDSDTVIGARIDGPGSSKKVSLEDSLTLMTCEVPAGTCTRIPETTNEQIVLPMGVDSTFVLNLDYRPES
jgi:hypothetical protein